MASADPLQVALPAKRTQAPRLSILFRPEDVAQQNGFGHW